MSLTGWEWGSAILQNMAETFLLINVYCTFLVVPKHYKRLKYLLIWIIALGYCVFINLIPLPTPARYILSFLLFLFYSVFWKGSFWIKLFSVCFDIALSVISSSIIYWWTSINTNASELSIDSLFFVVPNVLLLVTIGTIFHFLSASKWNNLTLPPAQWLVLTLYPFVSFFITLSLFSLSFSHPNEHLLLIFDASGLMITTIVHFFLMNRFNKQNQEIEKKQLLQQQIHLEEEKAKSLMDAYKEQRHLTHEFSNQMNVLSGLLEQNKISEATFLINSYVSQVYTGTIIVNTGNSLIDTILSQKYALAKKLGISVEFYLGNLQEIPISSPDMIVLISNLFDNAIEASENIDSPQIQIKIVRSDYDFVLSFRNRVRPGLVLPPNSLPKSSKKAHGHGIGLSNVVAILKKYNAEYTISCDKGWFQFTSLIWL